VAALITPSFSRWLCTVCPSFNTSQPVPAAGIETSHITVRWMPRAVMQTGHRRVVEPRHGASDVGQVWLYCLAGLTLPRQANQNGSPENAKQNLASLNTLRRADRETIHNC